MAKVEEKSQRVKNAINACNGEDDLQLFRHKRRSSSPAACRGFSAINMSKARSNSRIYLLNFICYLLKPMNDFKPETN